jgi:hypothetical protein
MTSYDLKTLGLAILAILGILFVALGSRIPVAKTISLIYTKCSAYSFPQMVVSITQINNLLKYLGAIMLLGGILGAIYFFFFVDTTVITDQPGIRVYNVGLMAHRQNGLILSLASAFLGALLFCTGHYMWIRMKTLESKSMIPSKKTAPVLGGKTAPVGAAGMSWRARRAGVAPLGTRVNARSNGRPDVVA